MSRYADAIHLLTGLGEDELASAVKARQVEVSQSPSAASEPPDPTPSEATPTSTPTPAAPDSVAQEAAVLREALVKAGIWAE